MKRIAVIIGSVLMLAGCQAEMVEVTITTDAIRTVQNGGSESVPFEAQFKMLADLDNDTRTMIDALERVVSQSIDIDEFEIKTEEFGFAVELEGSIPMSDDPNTPDPYFVLVSPSRVFDGYHTVELRTGYEFDMMLGQLTAINFMLAPDRYHPTQFRLRGDGLDLVAPAAEVDGEAHFLWTGPLKRRVNLTFRGGAYEQTGAGFLFR
ncbi:MAG: hypothetical protein NXI16_12590 [Alphaproteobacteria bacterium]|nr:hypothetical protein [Alphaproteobacteria bacterium]